MKSDWNFILHLFKFFNVIQSIKESHELQVVHLKSSTHIEGKPGLDNLRDLDLAAFVLLGLGHQDTKDTVLHACLDGVLVHAGREAE